MRTLLALAFLFVMSMTAIGSPGPDHQTPDLSIAFEETSFAPVATDFTITAAFDHSEIILVSQSKFGDYSFDLIDFSEGTIPDRIAVHRDLSEVVIELSKKPRDNYRLPIWDYLPSVKPPNRS